MAGLARRQIAIGLVVRAHGVRGEVVIRPFAADSCTLRPQLTVTLAPEEELKSGEGVALWLVERVRGMAQEQIVKWVGQDSRDVAEAQRGLVVHVDEADLPPPPPGEFYEYQWVGLEVRQDGAVLGHVDHVFSNGAHAVLAVHTEQGELMLPAVEGIVLAVDLAAGHIHVRVPQEC